MKKAIATFCLIGSTLALAACDTAGTGNVETKTPYDRTATHSQNAAPQETVAPAEPVFQKAQSK